jgi:hypothetical protein
LIFDTALEESLARVAELLRDAKEPWWLIGSAAVALHGGCPGQIRDVDVLLGHGDAERCFHELGLANLGQTRDAIFSSDLFARWTEGPLKIELMAGLKVKRAAGWEPVSIRTREEVRPGLFVPSRDELCAILLSFGRVKDLQRAATLR